MTTPAGTTKLDVVRVAALADLHYGRYSAATLQTVLAQAASAADILLVCGDLTDHGLPDEAHALVRELNQVVKVPIVAVLGNHDCESQQVETIIATLREAGIVVLDGDAYELHGIGFAGVKGFCGGFGRRALGPWGEEIIKKFVREAVDEALKLESALARLRNERLIAILHYSPIQQTVEGEPPEIYPYLGCSRLEEPLLRFPVSAVFHGHAHHGKPEGRTRTNVPVFNVSNALMREMFPDRPFRIVEVDMRPDAPPGERRSGADRRGFERVPAGS
jgi:Icc-related predicted phosphoesterase